MSDIRPTTPREGTEMLMRVAQGTRVVGVDPGLNVTGYGVIEIGPTGPALVEGGVLRGGRGAFPDRLRRLHEGLAEVLAEHQPAAMGLEDLFSHYQRPKTAVLMGHARGVLMLAAGQAGVPVSSYLPTKVKLTLTGSGRASKVQMQDAVTRELRLVKAPEPHDVADALAIAICHYYLGGGTPEGSSLRAALDAGLNGGDDDLTADELDAGIDQDEQTLGETRSRRDNSTGEATEIPPISRKAPPRGMRTGVYYSRRR